MMDYPQAAIGQQTNSKSPDRPYLARIGDAADEADRIANYVESFIDRCRGGGDCTNSGGPVPVPSGHLGELDRLTENLARLDKLARDLQTIG